jgi:hypothetical protein
MLTKTDRNRLIKVCKVLFPKYKRVTVDTTHKTVLLQTSKIWFVRWFTPKWRVSLTELIEFQIPSQMADFKYGNKTFINHVQEDLVRCEMNKQSKIDYFLEEITKIKYPDVYKQLETTPDRIITHTPVTPSEEDDVFEAMVRLYQGEEVIKPAPIKSYWVTKEAMFYLLLLLIVLWSCIRSLIP